MAVAVSETWLENDLGSRIRFPFHTEISTDVIAFVLLLFSSFLIVELSLGKKFVRLVLLSASLSEWEKRTLPPSVIFY